MIVKINQEVKDPRINKFAMKVLLICILFVFSLCKEKKTPSEQEIQQKEIIKKSSSDENYTIKIGLIDDSDGYTNIRLKSSSNSLIIGTILNGEFFIYNESNSDWYFVKTLSGLKGFVHKSRIKNANDKEKILLTINGYDPTDLSYDKDTIINVNSLNNKTAFFIRKFMYPKIKEVRKIEGKVFFSDGKIKIEISKTKFDANKYKIIKTDDRTYIKAKNGNKVYGVFGIPEYEFESIKIIYDELEYNLPQKKLENLLNPSFEKINIYKRSKNQIIISITGADNISSESYTVLFFLDRGTILKKYVFHGF